MITTSISITPYLAEYLIGKYNNGADEPIRIPDTSDLYHAIWQLMTRRPAGLSPIDAGNLTIILPERRVGKDPMVYNYLSERSIKMIEIHIKRMFNYDLHTALLENREIGSPLTNLDVVHRFLCEYGITTLSEDALLKNYYRYRENLRKRAKHREYKRKLKCG